MAIFVLDKSFEEVFVDFVIWAGKKRYQQIFRMFLVLEQKNKKNSTDFSSYLVSDHFIRRSVTFTSSLSWGILVWNFFFGVLCTVFKFCF